MSDIHAEPDWLGLDSLSTVMVVYSGQP